MKALCLICTIATLAASTAFAGPGLGYQPGDDVKSALERLTGQQVELRIKSGEKVAGKVEKVGGKSVHLVSLTGQEFFEALVVIDDISAVVVRAAGK